MSGKCNVILSLSGCDVILCASGVCDVTLCCDDMCASCGPGVILLVRDDNDVAG